VYAIKCAGAEAKYAPFKRLKNRMLLWKGARESSMASILAQGLHVPAPETPSASYPFGIASRKSIYIYMRIHIFHFKCPYSHTHKDCILTHALMMCLRPASALSFQVPQFSRTKACTHVDYACACTCGHIGCGR